MLGSRNYELMYFVRILSSHEKRCRAVLASLCERLCAPRYVVKCTCLERCAPWAPFGPWARGGLSPKQFAFEAYGDAYELLYLLLYTLPRLYPTHALLKR